MTNFDDLNPSQLAVVLKTGSLANLPNEYQEYYSLMEKVRGLRAKSTFNDKIITKAGIIKLLKNEHDLNDFQARRLFDDAINFFYAQENVKPEAFANLYADKLDEAATLALHSNQLETFERLTMSAAKLRGCFDKKAPEIPEEMYLKQIVIYTTTPQDVGLVPEDKKEVERMLDALPDIPAIKLQRVKADAGVKGFRYNIMRNMAEDIEDFVDEEDKKD
jgi:hypothetical protein